MKALLFVVLLGSTASADIRWDRMEDRIQGGGFLHYEISELHAVDDDPARMPGAREADDQILAGVRMGGVLGAGAHVGYFFGLDLLAGSTLGDRGFAYDVALMPLGIATRFGATGMIAVATGIGANGAVNTVDDGAIVPVQTTLELGRGIRLLGRARFSYVLGASNRQSGAPAIPFADEFDAMLGVRLGRSYNKFGFPSGNGYFLAVSYREQLGTRFVGATIGYSLDAALPRRFLDDARKHRDRGRRRREHR